VREFLRPTYKAFLVESYLNIAGLFDSEVFNLIF
jgi:hypothetical protein